MNEILGLDKVNETLTIHYLIYKITNKVNGKFYIGQHQTTNIFDGYMGSGKLIKKAIKKYGINQFIKEILFDFSTFSEMNNKEKELVQIKDCYPNNQLSYNLSEGGGSGKKSEIIKAISIQHQKETWKNKTPEELIQFGIKVSIGLSKRTPEQKQQTKEKIRLTNQNKSAEQKRLEYQKRSKASSGKNNPMYGHRCTEFMTEDKIQQRSKKISEALKKRVRKQETFDKISKANSGKNNPMYGRTGELAPHFGKKCMVNYDTKDVKYVSKDEQQLYLDNGYVFGNAIKGIKRSEETNQKNRLQHIGRKLMVHPITNKRKSVLPRDFKTMLNNGYIFIDKEFKYNG